MGVLRKKFVKILEPLSVQQNHLFKKSVIVTHNLHIVKNSSPKSLYLNSHSFASYSVNVKPLVIANGNNQHQFNLSINYNVESHVMTRTVTIPLGDIMIVSPTWLVILYTDCFAYKFSQYRLIRQHYLFDESKTPFHFHWLLFVKDYVMHSIIWYVVFKLTTNSIRNSMLECLPIRRFKQIIVIFDNLGWRTVQVPNRHADRLRIKWVWWDGSPKFKNFFL